MIPRPVTWLLVLFASVVLPLAVLSSWTATMVKDTDSWVETVGPLDDDPEVTEQVATRLTAATLAAVGSPYSDQPQVQVAVRRVVARVVGGPEFPPAWREANRVLHRELVRLLSSDRVADDETLRIDLAPLARDLADGLRGEGVDAPVDLSGRTLTVEVAPTEELEKARWGWDVVTTLGHWLPIAWAVLAVLVVISARRKLAAVGELAVGALLGLGALWAGLTVARGVVLDSAPALAEPLWDGVFASLVTTIQLGLVAAVVVLVLRIAVGLGRRPRTD